MPINVRSLRDYWPILLNFGCFVLLILAANVAADWIADSLNFDIRPSNEDTVHAAIMTASLAYTLLIAVPFVPGIEIGLTLIGVFGPPIVFLVYLCTIAGLALSFLVGRLIPIRILISFFEGLRFHRLSSLLRTIAPMSMQDRLAFITSKAPNRYVPLLLRHRYIALAVVVNIPGNVIIGGGGGIALMAGISRLYTLPGFLIAIAIAVAPLPLAILLFGEDVLSGWITHLMYHPALAIGFA